jgi:hypothetical protein
VISARWLGKPVAETLALSTASISALGQEARDRRDLAVE